MKNLRYKTQKKIQKCGQNICFSWNIASGQKIKEIWPEFLPFSVHAHAQISSPHPPPPRPHPPPHLSEFGTLGVCTPFTAKCAIWNIWRGGGVGGREKTLQPFIPNAYPTGTLWSRHIGEKHDLVWKNWKAELLPLFPRQNSRILCKWMEKVREKMSVVLQSALHNIRTLKSNLMCFCL